MNTWLAGLRSYLLGKMNKCESEMLRERYGNETVTLPRTELYLQYKHHEIKNFTEAH